MMGACGIQRDLTPQERVTNEWDTMAGEWDDLAGGYAAGFEKLLWSKLDEKDEVIQGWKVLDFGCGTGLLSDRLRCKVRSIVAMDVSSKMIDVLDEKIMSQEWTNTQSIQCVLAELSKSTPEIRNSVESHYGTVDLIVASSVLSFIPPKDVAATMQVLGKFLRPGGRLVHSDWPKSEAKHPDAMDTEKALDMYAQAGLTAVSTEILPLHAGGGGSTMEVFFGMAQKE